MKLSALILAAGRGRRIGTPKLMLGHMGKSFLKIIEEKIRNSGIKNIICAVSADTSEWAEKNVPGIRYVVNRTPESGMISSVYTVVNEISGLNSLLIIPVDHPYVSADTIKKIIETSAVNPACVIKPVHNGRSGHPVVIPNELFSEILKKDFSKGLDDLIKVSEIKQVLVNVNDIGIVKNINTPEDLK